MTKVELTRGIFCFRQENAIRASGLFFPSSWMQLREEQTLMTRQGMEHHYYEE